MSKKDKLAKKDAKKLQEAKVALEADTSGGTVVSAAPAAALFGSAQQEAPPPIEGPARAMVIMAHP
ncbi:MAG: hypothetical protein ABIQ47_15365, partial [Tepidiformaceae bacterium]